MIWIWNEVSIVTVSGDISTSGLDVRHIEFAHGVILRLGHIILIWAKSLSL